MFKEKRQRRTKKRLGPYFIYCEQCDAETKHYSHDEKSGIERYQCSGCGHYKRYKTK